MRSRVRCPDEACAAVFEVSAERLGRNVYCLSCGTRMTARPAHIERVLDQRERRAGGGSGAAVRRAPLVVVLDDIRSLWNVGSIFRTADACGVESLVLTGITGCPPRAEITKTALGAEEAVAWSYRKSTIEAIDAQRDRGYTPVALEIGPEATPLHEMEWPARVALVVGNEVAGVSPPILDACEARVSIPMYGVKDSLNVAVAFGIAAHAIATTLLESRESTGDDRNAGQDGQDR